MSCTLSIYKLDSCSNDQPICVLKEGEHVIGRGKLLECNDSRASRSHATIKIVNRNVTITSTHENPCFFQAANSKTVIILNKDVPAELKEGDKFGLFPDQFWFRVKFHVESILNNNLPLLNDIPEANETATLHKRSLNEDSNTSHSKMLKLETSCSNDCTTVNSSNITSKEATILVDSISQAEELSRSDNDEEQLNINILNINGIQTNSTNSSDMDKSVIEDQEVITAEAKTCKKEEVSSSDNEDEEEQINVNISNTGEITTDIVNSKDVDEPNPQDPSGSGTATDTKKVVRDKCWYGDNCYRKSTHHKKEFSHPGDSDYDSDPNDARPACSYGANCYRKNKDHRKDYKHSRTNKKMPPKRKRTATKRPTTGTNAESSEDDYDFDDPFLNDDSEDEYAEESWSESDSDDHNQDEDEDTKTLMKEAKRFVRKNK